MTLRAPLSIIVHDGYAKRAVSKFASGLRIRKSAPGGDASCEVRLKLPRDYFTSLGGGDLLRIDGPKGNTIWQGYLDNPGRGDGPSGQDFDLSAQGVQVIAQDRRQPLYYRDTDLSRWEQIKANSLAAGSTGQQGDDPTPASGDGTDGLIVQFPGGQPIASGATARMRYVALVDAGMDLGAVSFRNKSGKTDTNYRNDLGWSSTTGAPSGTNQFPAATIQNTFSLQFNRYVNGASMWTPGANRVFFQLRRSGGATTVGTGDDNTWTFWDGIAVLSRRYLSTGVLATSSTDMVTADYVTADAVVWDLLWRMLPQVDRVGATVEVPGTPAQIDQLAFPDGATVGEVLDHLMEHEPNYYWSIGPGSASGLSFAWRAWPTTPRYEISTADGFDQPGGDFELCNRVTVTWEDAAGRTNNTVVYAASSSTATIAGSGFAIGAASSVFNENLAALEQAGRIKDAEPVELPTGRGSVANAQRIGGAVLTAAADPPESATAVLRRPIRDLLKGGVAMPWEIEPGYLVRVRETGQLIRLTETEYDDDEGAVTLTLGNPQPDVDDLVARLARAQRRTA